ncbi:nucleoside diphosphate kinase [Cladochytrium replicatum]|nr:nucleoside diphosphate kinase [Cladochytrium replicatum]
MFSRAGFFLTAARAVSRQIGTASTVALRANPTRFATASALALAGAGACLAANGYTSVHAEGETTVAGTKGGIERTFIAIKPDGTQRQLVGEIIRRFETKGYKLVAIKAIVPSKDLAEKHYEDLKTRPFFKGLVGYMTSGKAPVIAMVWEGKDVIRQGRRIIGATNPLEAQPGTIRGDLCMSVGRNIIHGSDSFESATKEIALWFRPNEVFKWEFGNAEWITAEN